VNCGANPGELMQREFSGHRGGSCTGASSDKEGLFQAANGGTLFLDEVADLPLPMQVKLLRAIQEKAVRPVGSQQESTTDVRLLSATHKDLARLVEAGDFRQDLYYRINVIELKVPSLKERAEDIPLFVEDMLGRLAREYGGEPPNLSPAAMDALKAYSFPGNVRELENILERAYTLCEDDCIEASDLQFSPAAQAGDAERYAETPREGPQADAHPADSTRAMPSPDDGSLEDYLESIERHKITEALEATRWNKTAAAKRLGITFRALRYRLKKLGME